MPQSPPAYHRIDRAVSYMLATALAAFSSLMWMPLAPDNLPQHYFAALGLVFFGLSVASSVLATKCCRHHRLYGKDTAAALVLFALLMGTIFSLFIIIPLSG